MLRVKRNLFDAAAIVPRPRLSAPLQANTRGRSPCEDHEIRFRL